MTRSGPASLRWVISNALPLSSGLAQILLELVPCAVTQVCGGQCWRSDHYLACEKPWTMFKQVGHSCWLCMMPNAMLQCTNSIIICVTALRVVWRLPLKRVQAGYKGGPGWDTNEFHSVVCCLAEAPHGAVVLDTLHAKLFKATVRAMVKANLLAYRPASGRRCAV